MNKTIRLRRRGRIFYLRALREPVSRYRRKKASDGFGSRIFDEAMIRLGSIDDRSGVIVGDLILPEILRGVRGEAHARLIERNLREFRIMSMLDDALAVKTTRDYRFLRGKGVTVRKTIDMIIGTYCIEQDCTLLHRDRDFDPMAEHLGLRIA